MKHLPLLLAALIFSAVGSTGCSQNSSPDPDKNDKPVVALIMKSLANEFFKERRAGLEEAMKTAGIEVVSIQSAQWEMEKANTGTSAILTSHPGLAAILASNDSMAPGAAAAVKVAGREKSVKIVGFDNISAVQSLIKEGRIFATVDQHGDELAVFGIQRALSHLGGERASGDQSTPVDLITVETLP